MIHVKLSDNKRCVEIFIEHECWKKVDKRLYSPHLRKIRSCLDKKALNDLFSILEPQVALTYVYMLLTRRGYLENELRQKLKDKYFEDSTIEVILGRCRELGYVDDQKEIQGFIDRETRKGKGPRLIEQGLKKKSGAYVKVVFSEEKEKEQVQKLLSKRFPNISDVKIKQRAFRFLQRRGFSEHVIHQLLFIENESCCL